ncbi:M23/M37 family peptidase [Desmospora sp. 8437]|nr:M23/M37 family peptidase [Desmospora sp. 8437]
MFFRVNPRLFPSHAFPRIGASVYIFTKEIPELTRGSRIEGVDGKKGGGIRAVD